MSRELGSVSSQGSKGTVYPLREHLNSVQRMVSGIHSQKNPYFHNVRAIRANRLRPAIRIFFRASKHDKTIFRPASSLEPLLEGLLGSSGGFGRKFPEGGLNFLEVALVWKFPYGNHPKQSSKKFAPEPPKLLRSPFRSGPMRKLVAELSYTIRQKKGVRFGNPETNRFARIGPSKAVSVDFKKNTPGKVGIRSRAVSAQGSRQVCLSRCPKSHNLKHFAIP